MKKQKIPEIRYGLFKKEELDWSPRKEGILEGLIDFWHFLTWPDEKYYAEQGKKASEWYKSELKKGMERLIQIPKTGRTVHIGIEIPGNKTRKELINSMSSSDSKNQWLKVLRTFDKVVEESDKVYLWPDSCIDSNVFLRGGYLEPGDTAILYGGAREMCLSLLAEDLIVKGVNVAYSIDGSM